jgi:HEPN domain-containing protein
MTNRANDWFLQAERDLEQAEASKTDERHEWACFAAQQAAEKAVKALHLSLGQEAWGHVVARLLKDLPLPVPETLIDQSRVLDGFYIPTRYANGHPEGPPFEHYGRLQSREAIQYAGEILQFVRTQMAGPNSGGYCLAGLGRRGVGKSSRPH